MKNETSEGENDEEIFHICWNCRKHFFLTNKVFFEHIIECKKSNHINSPITIRWYTKEELIEKEPVYEESVITTTLLSKKELIKKIKKEKDKIDGYLTLKERPSTR